MPSMRVNGIEIYYERHGPEDGEPVVLNNGIFMSTPAWAFQLPALARRYRVLVYDMRGQGQSDHPPGEYSMDLHAQDLTALLDALGLETAHLVGTSYGGALNVVMAARHPRRCRTIVNIASVTHREPRLAAIIDRWRVAAALADGARFFRLVQADVYSEAFLRERQDLLAMARQRYEMLDYAAAVRLIDCFQGFDARADLGSIHVPTCIVSAEHDVLKPPSYGAYAHASIPGSEFYVIPDAGQAVVFERPEEVNTVILGFLAKHASA